MKGIIISELDVQETLKKTETIEEKEAYLSIISAGTEFRKAGIEPVYVYDMDNEEIMVTTELMIRNKLH